VTMSKPRCIDCNYRYPKPRSQRCKICARRRTRDRKHHAHITKTYGVTIEEYYEMLEQQGSGCAICGGGTSRRYFAVDHNHATGEPRGLLCARCNKILAAVRDNPDTLRQAARYLDDPPARATLGIRDWSDYRDD